MVQTRCVFQVAVRTFVDVNPAITTIRRVRNALHVLEIHTNLPHALQLPIHNVQLAPSHRMPRLLVVAGVAGRVTRDTISTPPYTVLSVCLNVYGAYIRITILHVYPKPRMHELYETRPSIVGQLQWL